MKTSVAHPHHDALELVASPMKLSGTPVSLRRAPPLLGQHTDEVLAELGLDAEARAALRAQGAIGPAP
jgi:crotonobetainyl-CoA:carnitine CoA-transferase CaiB-like acyl-CoA transferase